MNQLCVITTYFNPCNYKTRRSNYDIFVEGLRKVGVNYITVECAFGDDAFDLPDSINVIKIRSQSLLWQKERLLNLAASWLPESCQYVAWLDCDIIFDNLNWAKNLITVLQQHKVAQVFETCLRRNENNILNGTLDIVNSFALVTSKQANCMTKERYDAHGHTGYGWAMHRNIFDGLGLYEHAISGSADHFMAHAIFNSYGFCVDNALKHDAKQIQHFVDWGNKFYTLVKGSLGVVPGRIQHLWHGETANRSYFTRMHDITNLGYDPYEDLSIVPGRPIEWSASFNKPKLAAYFGHYFYSRLEDGNL